MTIEISAMSLASRPSSSSSCDQATMYQVF
jgi:hypothetical protein